MKVTAVGLRHLSSLTSLTRLHFQQSNKHVAFLQHLVGLQDLNADLGIRGSRGVRHLASLTSLTKLQLGCCCKMTDEDVSCLTNLVALRDLTLQRCWSMTDVGVENLASLTYLVTLHLNFIPLLTD